MSVSRSRMSPKGCALPMRPWTSCTRVWPALGFVPSYHKGPPSLDDVGHQAEVVPHFLQEVARVLRPGGLFLSAEWGVQPTLHPEHPRFADNDVYIPKTVSFYKAASCVGVFLSYAPALAPCSCIISDIDTLYRALRHRSFVLSDRLPPSRSLCPSSGPYPSLPLTLPIFPPLLHLSVR
jgi:SAM-dependent methyltransferase